MTTDPIDNPIWDLKPIAFHRIMLDQILLILASKLLDDMHQERKN